MKKTFALIFISFILTCKLSNSQKAIRQQALKLNDSAVNLNFIFPKANGRPIPVKFNTGNITEYDMNTLLIKKIALLNQAIKLDSTLFIAYWNKFVFLNGLKQYEKSVLTGKKMIVLRPNDANVQYLVGEEYENMGDSMSAKHYYTMSLKTNDQLLTAVNAASKTYKSIQLTRAIDFILLRQPEKRNKIIRELYRTAIDSNYNVTYRLLLNITRDELIHGKTNSNLIKKEHYLNGDNF